MQGNLNAYGIISCVLFTVAVILMFGRFKTLKEKGILFPVAVFAGLFLFFFFTVSAISTSYGAPVHQMAIPLLCIFTILLTVSKKEYAAGFTAIILILIIFLVGHYNHIVSAKEYSCGLDHYRNAIEQHAIDTFQTLFESSSFDMDKEYSAGWADKLLLKIEQLKARGIDSFDDMASFKDVKQWHSWFTGLYATEKLYPWYPGGKLKDNIKKMEFRQREK